MPRMKSEIHEQFLQIADACGLTKKAAEESADLKKYKDDPEARVGSDDLSTIEVMYGVKPDGQEYEWNIMEQAHPNAVIIAPSYDKINGLVENEIERSDIIRNIVQKVPTGNLTNHKYATSALLMELVRVANEMDARNKEELFTLADSCIEELSACQRQTRVKTALGPLAIVGIAAAVLGAGWLLSHTDNVDHGPLANIDAALKALVDLRTNSWYESDVDATVQKEADELIVHIKKLRNAVVNFNKISDAVYKPRTLSELKELVALKQNAQSNGDEIAAATNEFKQEVLELEPLLAQAIDNFSSDVYQKQHTKPSAISNMTGWLGEALHGRWGLVSNDFISAVNALNPLKKSVEELAHRLESMDKVIAKYTNDIQLATSSLDSGERKQLFQGSPSLPALAPKENKENDYASMIASITGKSPEKGELDFLQHLMGQ